MNFIEKLALASLIGVLVGVLYTAFEGNGSENSVKIKTFAKVNLVTLEDGTRCAVLGSRGGIHCDWVRK